MPQPTQWINDTSRRWRACEDCGRRLIEKVFATDGSI
jgi:hypothetical protein